MNFWTLAWIFLILEFGIFKKKSEIKFWIFATFFLSNFQYKKKRRDLNNFLKFIFICILKVRLFSCARITYSVYNCIYYYFYFAPNWPSIVYVRYFQSHFERSIFKTYIRLNRQDFSSRRTSSWSYFASLRPFALVPSSILPQPFSSAASITKTNSSWQFSIFKNSERSRNVRSGNFLITLWFHANEKRDTYTQFLLTFRCHESLLGLLGLGGLLQPFPHLGLLPVLLLPLPSFFLFVFPTEVSRSHSQACNIS